MRNSFNPKYLTDVTQHILEELKSKEEKVIQHLSLITYFEPDEWVPRSIFNSMMDVVESTPYSFSVQECLDAKRPYGLRKMQSFDNNQRPWGHHDAMSLLLKENSMRTFRPNYILVISPLLAKEILTQLQEKKECKFEKLVDELLDLLEEHCSQNNSMSREFTQTVCKLFKERRYEEKKEERGESTRKQFSELVLYLQDQDSVGKGEKQKDSYAVLRLMKRCFDMSKDPFVAQQLSRYYKELGEFEMAEETIKNAIQLSPRNPFLYDTYGQIYRSWLEKITKTKEISVEDALKAIQCVDIAVQQFKAAEALSHDYECDLSSYLMEVLTVLHFLERMGNIVSLKQNQTLIAEFLNGKIGTTMKAMKGLQPALDIFIRQSPFQNHVESSLRYVEYSDNMFHNKVSVVKISNSQNLLLTTRERFEMFYPSGDGSKTFKFGPTFKSIQEAFKRDKERLNERVSHAILKFQENRYEEYDLLYYTGCKVLEFSVGRNQEKFREAQKLSRKLVEIQVNKSKPYVEAFMYFVLLNWPTEDRLSLETNEVFNAESFRNYIHLWKTKFEEMFQPKVKVKTFFFLGKRGPGKDIVDSARLREQWRKDTSEREGKERIETMEDNIFDHPIGRKNVLKMEGVVDERGQCVIYKVLFQ